MYQAKNSIRFSFNFVENKELKTTSLSKGFITQSLESFTFKNNISNCIFVQQPRCFYISPPQEKGKWAMIDEKGIKYAQKFSGKLVLGEGYTEIENVNMNTFITGLMSLVRTLGIPWSLHTSRPLDQGCVAQLSASVKST